MKELFSGAAQVSIQGERVLRLLNFTGNQAKYEVIGFENMPVILVDSRRTGLLAVQELLETGDLYAFAPKFSHPALVHILQDGPGQVQIELSDTDQPPAHMLWIAIGLDDLLPVYDYIYENIVPLYPGAGYAFISLYQLPESDRYALTQKDANPADYISSLPAWDG